MTNPYQTSGKQVLQWVLFFLLTGLFYIFETSGSTLKPLLLIPAGLCIASHTGEIRSMAVGSICGFLLDLACGKLLGFNAVCMMLMCVLSSLLYHYWLRQKLLNTLALTAVCAFVQSGLDYAFFYALWGYEDVHVIWEHIMLPSCLMTIISGIPIYFIIHGISKACGNERTHELEKAKINERGLDL